MAKHLSDRDKDKSNMEECEESYMEEWDMGRHATLTSWLTVRVVLPVEPARRSTQNHTGDTEPLFPPVGLQQLWAGKGSHGDTA